MLKVGLTGSIGSGKSIVANIFNVLGVPIFNADAESKKIIHTDTNVKNNIIDLFGEAAYSNGVFQNKYIAAIVFQNKEKLAQLAAIVQPATIAASNRWMQQQTTHYAVKEAALFFEVGSAASMDYMIGVDAPISLRMQRTMQRDNATRASVAKRIESQIDNTIKMALCNFVIINDGQNLIIPQVLSVHKTLLSIK